MTAAAPGGGAPPSDLVSRLGLAADARAIILNADDYGMCRAANRAVSELLLAGHVDSATVMVPCGWAPTRSPSRPRTPSTSACTSC